MLLRADFKRLGDLAAGTLVVYRQTRRTARRARRRPSRVAPARPLRPAEQAAIVSLAGRATRLTPERFDELAALALPVPGGPDGSAARRATPARRGAMGAGPAPRRRAP